MKSCASLYCVLCALLVVLAYALLPAAVPRAADDALAADLLLQATQAYKNAEYSKAAALYERMLSGGMLSGKLHYNLGNAYLKSGRPGKALLHYRKAELLIPRNEDLQSNLSYALGQTRDKIECKGFSEVAEDFCFWYTRMSLSELAWVTIVLNALLWLLMLIRVFWRREIMAVLLALCLFAALVSGASAGVKYVTMLSAPPGVVVAPEIMVRAGNSLNDTVLFKLHEGAEFTWGESSDGWVKIRLCDGKKGWVQEGTVSKVGL